MRPASEKRWPAVRVASAWEQVAHAIKSEITTRGLPEGSQLPPETVLADELAVSRGTLRLALRHLVDEGVIETRRGARAGTFVVRPGALAEDCSGSTLIEVMRVRRLIEVPAAGMAAKGADPERLAEIDEARLGACTGQERFEANRTFHEELMRGGAPIWSALAQPIFAWLGDNISRDPRDLTRSETDDAHTQILDAVRQRDEACAMAAMSSHLNNLASCYVRMLDHVPPGRAKVL
jgi:GntR family transcriptional repressor for pyruvate dehydrogenase complex